MEKKEMLEISTGIGCPVGCLKYCPQEVTIKRYHSLFGEQTPRLMSLSTFEKILDNTSKNVSLMFAGYFEPFANPDFVSMLKLADNQGRPIELNTTLWGIKKENIEEIAKIRFNYVCVHLPDGKNMREPLTENYRDLFFEFQQNVSRLKYMSMNDFFISNNRENVVRGIHNQTKGYGYCTRFHEEIAPVVLPNGATYLCCNDFGLRNYVGNLMEEPYSAIKRRIVQNEGQFKECQFCSWNQPLVGHTLSSTMTRVASIVKNIG